MTDNSHNTFVFSFGRWFLIWWHCPSYTRWLAAEFFLPRRMPAPFSGCAKCCLRNVAVPSLNASQCLQNITYFLFDFTLLRPFLQDWWSFISYQLLLWLRFLFKVKEASPINSSQYQWEQAGVFYCLLAGLARNWSVLHTNYGFVNWHLIRQKELELSKWGRETNLEKCQISSFWYVTLPVLRGKAGQLSEFWGDRPGGVLAAVSWLGA